jgi:alpha-amylase
VLGWFQNQSEYAFAGRKTIQQSVRQQSFYSIAEVYNYNISAGKILILEIRKWIISKMALTAWSILNSNMTPKRLWIYILKVFTILNGELKGNSVLNYLSSHDDGGPFTRTKLLKQVQNFYFLRNCSRYFMVMKAPVL